MEKNIWIAYLLWVIGSFFGLHLLYLRRDRQAFLWMCTAGGYLGFGVLRDLFRIPEYVQDVNNDEKYIQKLTDRMRKSKKPPFSLVRFVGQIIVGSSWSYLMASAVPKEEIFGWSLVPLTYLSPIGTALAVWNIGNIGRERGDLKWALIGAFIPLAIIPNWSPVFSSVFFNWKSKEWRKTPYTRKSLCKRFTTLAACGLLFSSLWLSFLYFNATVTDKHGERIKLRDAAKNFFNSPMFLEFKKNLQALIADIKENGWANAWAQFVEQIDPLGEKHAMKVLGLEKGSTQEEITSAYRKLAKEWHPDRHQEEEKEHAHQRFIEIKEAYEKLSTIKRQRAQKNQKFESEE